MDTTVHDFETVQLLNFEKMQLRAPTITRVTFYEGEPPLEYIKDRLTEICDKNPWLRGRLASRAGKLLLRYPNGVRDIAGCMRVVQISGLRFDMGFAELTKILKDVVIRRGSLCLNKEEDLFRLVVVNIADGRFAVVLSMSHAYADGYTSYEIHKMFSRQEPVRALLVERVHSFRRDLDSVIRGGYDILPWLLSPGVALNVVGSMLRGRTPTQNVFVVDERKIEQHKQEYRAKNGAKFISANDVITSAFFARTACDVIFVVVNFRDRIPHITKNHAGNYEALVGYQREDFASPELIRRSLVDNRRPLSGRLPGFFRATRAKLGIITNLASTYEDAELPGCRLLFHRPVIDSSALVPFEDAVYIFKSSKGQLCLSTCCKETSFLADVEILKDRIV